jgi:glycosyltransferase involved in cell wall biosynthesis
MKILLYSHFWTPSVGGVETVASELAAGLARAGSEKTERFEVTLVTDTAAGAFDDRSVPFRVVRQPSLGTWLRELRAADIAELEGPALLPQFLAWILRKRVVLRHHAYQSVCPNGLLIVQTDRSLCPSHFMAGNYARCVDCNAANMSRSASRRSLWLTFPRRWLAKRATANVSVSQYVANTVHLTHSSVIWNGVPVVPAAAAITATAPVRFAFVGRLVHEKGVQVLLRAAAILAREDRPFEVIVIGDGPEREKLESLVRELQVSLHVRICGAKRGEDLDAALEGVAAVAMPSLWAETFGLAAVEQMMRGRATIVSDFAGLAEAVGDTGLKFPMGDADALAACMRRIIEDPSLAARLGAAARKRAETQLTAAQMCEKTATLYDSIR